MSFRRRHIEDDDLERVATLLAKGFPRKSRAFWRGGLERLRERAVPAGMPRYGLMLESAGTPRAVLLMICASVETGEGTSLRCHLSSWFAEPDCAAFAPILLSAALKNRDVTYINVSPAPHTQAIVEAQGFRAFCRGSMLYLPWLARPRRGTRISALTDTSAAAFPEGELLRAHLAFGCPCFAIEREGERLPFVFAPMRRVRRVLPATTLLYCRDTQAFARHAGALGRALLGRGIVAVLVDADQPIAGLHGRRVNSRQNKYVFGPHPPRPGDLAYSELAVFHG